MCVRVTTHGGMLSFPTVRLVRSTRPTVCLAC